MRIVWTAVRVVALAAGIVGCSASADSPRRSKTATTGSGEYERAKAEQDEYVRQAKEAERQAMGSHAIE